MSRHRGGVRINLHQWGFLLLVLAGIVLIGCSEPKRTSEPGQAKTIKTASGLEMVYLSGGEFMMGVNEGPIDAKPAHVVKIAAFLMDQTEVTQTAYETLMGGNPSRQKNPKNPVEQVTWVNAARFCNKRSVAEGLAPAYNTNTWQCDFEASGYRLPTEAEWEYGCRGGVTNQYYFGDRAEELKSNGWFEGNAQSHPHPVSHWKANSWGLYDMIGNVSEWCNDFYSVKYYRNSPQENPKGPDKGEKRVLRGGAWSSSAENCTSWVRNCDEAGFTDVCLTMDSDGFRCVRKASSAETTLLSAAHP